MRTRISPMEQVGKAPSPWREPDLVRHTHPSHRSSGGLPHEKQVWNASSLSAPPSPPVMTQDALQCKEGRLLRAVAPTPTALGMTAVLTKPGARPCGGTMTQADPGRTRPASAHWACGLRRNGQQLSGETEMPLHGVMARGRLMNSSRTRPITDRRCYPWVELQKYFIDDEIDAILNACQPRWQWLPNSFGF